MGQESAASERTVMVHEGVAIPISPKVALAILDFAREKASGKLEINFASGGVAGVVSIKSKKY